ncbi:cytochrome P450 ClCP1 [Colletotrichum cuscutae]|uniref:Cytochrome P450 ClCP1 n=1 Tax=Colletotrichum cuscutae TaxID=1209917 RepID=A0AAI9UHJ2_9PEZI|nr:cytochrome P450 ClCP1 [Colletotrichum cuscutae]
MAYAELRIIFAKLIWNFDLELTEESKKRTLKQKTYLIWQKHIVIDQRRRERSIASHWTREYLGI